MSYCWYTCSQQSTYIMSMHVRRHYFGELGSIGSDMGFLQGTMRSSRGRQPVSLRLMVIAGSFLIFLLVLALRSTTGSLSNAAPANLIASQGIEVQPLCPDAGECTKLPSSVAEALIHYATSNITPQQTPRELNIGARVLEARSPCNFLVFGLGFDSLLWATLNYGGRTVFLEEDKDWIAQIARKHPELKAYHVLYSTMVTQARDLLPLARSHECRPSQGIENSPCSLALSNLPPEVLNTQWDAIMIDAPRGYFPEAPGRMTAIYTAAVMARNRKDERSTDIFVHDVDREVEEKFSKAFLCEENLVEAEGRLWHFSVPANRDAHEFCIRDSAGMAVRKLQTANSDGV
uniref:Uncharacterized protein n=1 Tax=Araucaria cunninghamii TaxID=56994 RepID=A0A0D6R783_ARACU